MLSSLKIVIRKILPTVNRRQIERGGYLTRYLQFSNKTFKYEIGLISVSKMNAGYHDDIIIKTALSLEKYLNTSQINILFCLKIILFSNKRVLKIKI